MPLRLRFGPEPVIKKLKKREKQKDSLGPKLLYRNTDSS